MTLEQLIQDAPPAPATGEAPAEFDAVQLWVREQLIRLGYVGYVADELVRRRVDWHELARLVENGCPAELALEII